MDRWDEGFWCDVCHQKHYQINPACNERRRQREYEQSPEGKRALKEMIVKSVVASQALAGVHIGRDEAAALLDELEGQPLPEIEA